MRGIDKLVFALATLALLALAPASVRAQDATVPPAGETAGAAGADEPAAGVPSPAEAAQAESDREYTEALRRRVSIAKIHRIFGISTWFSMIGTLTLGFIRYHDLYGFFDGQGDNPCVQGTAVFQDGCASIAWPHMISSLVTTALYSTTFSLSLLMPDPDDSSVGESAFAGRLRTHKILRWVHFFGMVSQIALGAIMANLSPSVRANDYGTLQALATIHMGLGLVTFGAITWAGALMVF